MNIYNIHDIYTYSLKNLLNNVEIIYINNILINT